MTSDPFTDCKAEKPRPADAEKPYRKVECNRPNHHQGPHRVTDPRTFARLHEWTEES